MFTSANLAMFHDVMDEEEGFFIDKVSKAQIIAVSVIQEFVSRTLQRMVYGSTLFDKFNFKVWDRRIKLSVTRPHIDEVFVDYFSPITFLISIVYSVLRMRKKKNRLEMFCPSNIYYENKISNIQRSSRTSFRTLF